jgi:5-(aminomethyl)-3-furanmethanol phosphate kinase
MTSRASGSPTTHSWREGRLSGQGAGGRPQVMQPQVIKIGGSLLARPRWPDELAELLVGRDEPLVVVGGGSVVDGLRAVDAASPRSPELVHELAIAAMGITGRLVADALGLPVVQAPGLQAGVLDMAAWLAASPQGDVPASWDVTSDSLAALVARATGRGLVLVKSVPPPVSLDLDALAAAGWVDAHFPRVASALAEITWAAPAAPFGRDVRRP